MLPQLKKKKPKVQLLTDSCIEPGSSGFHYIVQQSLDYLAKQFRLNPVRNMMPVNIFKKVRNIL